MSLVGIILIVLVLALLGGLPSVGYAPAAWGYYPSGLVGLVIVILVILLLLGRI